MKQKPIISEKQFKALPKAKRIVEVAKHVLNLISAKKFNIRTNHGFVVLDQEPVLEVGTELQDALPRIYGHCSVCALGGCLLALVEIADDYKITRELVFGDRREAVGPMYMKMKGLMGEKMAQMIEVAFEKGDGMFNPDRSSQILYKDGEETKSLKCALSEKEMKAAIKFGERFREPKARFRAILNNIIENKGKFKP